MCLGILIQSPIVMEGPRGGLPESQALLTRHPTLWCLLCLYSERELLLLQGVSIPALASGSLRAIHSCRKRKGSTGAQELLTVTGSRGPPGSLQKGVLGGQRAHSPAKQFAPTCQLPGWQPNIGLGEITHNFMAWTLGIGKNRKWQC